MLALALERWLPVIATAPDRLMGAPMRMRSGASIQRRSVA